MTPFAEQKIAELTPRLRSAKRGFDSKHFAAVRRRYHLLVDKKMRVGLTYREQKKIESLMHKIDVLERNDDVKRCRYIIEKEDK